MPVTFNGQTVKKVTFNGEQITDQVFKTEIYINAYIDTSHNVHQRFSVDTSALASGDSIKIKIVREVDSKAESHTYTCTYENPVAYETWTNSDGGVVGVDIKITDIKIWNASGNLVYYSNGTIDFKENTLELTIYSPRYY